MNRDESEYALPIALAGLRLTFHCTTALLQHGLLSPAKRQECAQALQDLHLHLEQLATDEDHAFDMLAGVRDLIDRLQDHP